MITKVQKWGNSQGLRLSKDLLSEASSPGAFRRLLTGVALSLLVSPQVLAAVPALSKSGPEFRLNAFTFASQYHVAVARISASRFVHVWESIGQGLGGGSIVARIFEGSTPVTGEVIVANGSAIQVVGYPDVAAAADGTFVVSWIVNPHSVSNRAVMVRRFSDLVHPTTDAVRADTGGNSVDFPKVASDEAGNFVVAWAGTDDDNQGIVARFFDKTAVALDDPFIANTYTAGWQNAPAVADLGDGTFLIGWTSLGQIEYGDIFAQRFNGKGERVGGEFRLNDVVLSNQQEVSLAATGDGGFAATWSSLVPVGNSLFEIRARIFDASDSPLTEELQVNTYSPFNQGASRAAVGDAKNILIVWQSFPDQDGSGSGVFARLFSLTGEALSEEIQVNSFLAGNQFAPAVSAGARGSFVVVWDSYQQDGSLEGVFAQGFKQRQLRGPRFGR